MDTTKSIFESIENFVLTGWQLISNFVYNIYQSHIFQNILQSFKSLKLDSIVTCCIDSYTNLWQVEDELHMAIYDAFNANKLVIPFPIRTVYLKKETS